MAAALKYPLPSSVNVANFVWVRPCMKRDDDDGRRDFWNRKHQMLCLLESQDVLGFVDGEIQKPSVEIGTNYKAWRRTDRLVKGWILGSIGNDALHAVSGKETAKDVWLELESIFKKQEEKEEAIEEDEEESDNRGSARDDNSSSSNISKKLVELYKTARRGDWDMETVKNNSTTVFGGSYKETPLHVAVMTGKANHLVKKLVETMPLWALDHKNYRGDTALHDAAMVGNTKAAAALLEKCHNLLLTPNIYGVLPVTLAAMCNRRNTPEYLISKHEANEEHKAFLSHGKLVRNV